jgi:hypothetical protein
MSVCKLLFPGTRTRVVNECIELFACVGAMQQRSEVKKVENTMLNDYTIECNECHVWRKIIVTFGVVEIPLSSSVSSWSNQRCTHEAGLVVVYPRYWHYSLLHHCTSLIWKRVNFTFRWLTVDNLYQVHRCCCQQAHITAKVRLCRRTHQRILIHKHSTGFGTCVNWFVFAHPLIPEHALYAYNTSYQVVTKSAQHTSLE